MKEIIIEKIMLKMSSILTNEQGKKLENVLIDIFSNFDVVSNCKSTIDEENSKLLNIFIESKRVEGCSEKTLKYYALIINNLLKTINKNLSEILTEDLRGYLNDYRQKNNAGKVSIDNVRRILSSFFSWLEEENYIIKNPVKRIHKIKSAKIVKEVYSQETMQLLRDSCKIIRDLAIVDFLSSTGVRVGELVKLNISDIDFNSKECIVFGKGAKERRVYFNSSTKIHLLSYINGRTDNNNALFVSLLKPNKRLEISGVEIMLRNLGRKIGLKKVHPHKFRRTLATEAIDKGMPVEQVQKLLGHSKIDTTMEYAMVDQNNVRNSYRKYIG